MFCLLKKKNYIVLHAKKEKLYPAYISKHNSNREKKDILLIIPN